MDWEEEGADILLPLGQAYLVQLRGGPGQAVEAGATVTKSSADKVTVRSGEGKDVTNSDVRVIVDAKHRIYQLICMQVRQAWHLPTHLLAGASSVVCARAGGGRRLVPWRR